MIIGTAGHDYMSFLAGVGATAKWVCAVREGDSTQALPGGPYHASTAASTGYCRHTRSPDLSTSCPAQVREPVPALLQVAAAP